MARSMSASPVILLSASGGTDRIVPDGFVQDYNVRRLVFVEFHDTLADAILREKRVKRWRRVWKLDLIERQNPQWRDLYDELVS